MAKLPPPDDDDAIADANMLFGDSPARPKSSRSEPTKPPVSEEYDVEGWDDQDDAPAPVARAPIASPKPEKKKPKRDPLPDDDEPRVIEVWSRWGEWSNTILKMAGAGAIILVIVYSLLNSGAYSPAFLIFLIGLAILAALSYPIAITLERPVRMTPEQAIRDYFAALSHHFPQYRRMWLLLSERGRNAREFSAFPEYQIIMKKRLAELRGSQVKSSTPLAFEVTDFKAEKSAGLKTIDVKYTLVVSARGANGEPLHTSRIDTTLAKGPDSMWYLDDGTIPR